ncbi:PqqD family protein [Jeotgalibacillus aurantiacus]|uniref:PqqD family protein n=1 Tax=Jeotgalibacillus aurantiacus TaxID=2763266 RepID=UPI001D0A1937|nr:PqqD family protein [Jeotgalibacillus aurantiacus]
MRQYSLTGEQEKMSFNDEAVILHAEQFTVTTLNDTGLYCWELLNQGKSFEEIRTLLYVRYDAPPEQINQDLIDFMQDLERKGLVKNASE